MSVKVRRCDESARANGECVASAAVSCLRAGLYLRDGVVGACTAAKASAADIARSRLLLWSRGLVARRGWEEIRTARLLLVHGECGQAGKKCDVVVVELVYGMRGCRRTACVWSGEEDSRKRKTRW